LSQSDLDGVVIVYDFQVLGGFWRDYMILSFLFDKDDY